MLTLQLQPLQFLFALYSPIMVKQQGSSLGSQMSMPLPAPDDCDGGWGVAATKGGQPAATNSSRAPGQRWAEVLLNSVVIAVFVAFCAATPARAAASGRMACGLLITWLTMAAALDCSQRAVARVLQLQLEPSFCNPFTATTLAAFWSRHWNVTQVGLCAGRLGTAGHEACGCVCDQRCPPLPPPRTPPHPCLVGTVSGCRRSSFVTGCTPPSGRAGWCRARRRLVRRRPAGDATWPPLPPLS